MKRVLSLITLMACLYALPGYGSDTKLILWEDLIPPLPTQENPLADMSEEDAGFVEYIIYLRLVLPEKATPDTQEYFDEVAKALPELKKQGIDVDKIIEDRVYRNSVTNTELDGKVVRIDGYLLPLDLSGNSVTDFLLVPYVGACIHVPPPPPNQIVHAVSESPVPFEPDDLFMPVSVTGKLEAKSISKELFLVDGSSDIDIGYTMSVKNIAPYKPE